MSLQVWFPFNGNPYNYGLDNVNITYKVASDTFENNSKIASKSLKMQSTKLQFDLNNPINTANGMTISFWMYGLEPTNWTDVLSLNSFQDRFEFNRFVNNKYQYIWFTGDGEGRLAPTNTTLMSLLHNEWNHIVIKTNGNSSYFYLNGELQIITEAKPYIVYTCAIGARVSFDTYSNSAYSGLINDFRIYDNALSEKEIQELVKPLIMHYKFSQPGQFNLLRNSLWREMKSTDISKWEKWSFSSDDAILEYAETFIENNILYAKVKSDLSSNIGYQINVHNEDSFLDGKNKSYIFSTKIRGKGYFSIYVNWRSTESDGNKYSHSTRILATEKEQTISFEIPNHSDSPILLNRIIISFGAYSVDNQESEIWIREPKFEEGTIVTPWMPHMKDQLYTQLGYNNDKEYECTGWRKHGTYMSGISGNTDFKLISSDTPRYNTSTYLKDKTTINSYDWLANQENPELTFNFWLKVNKNVENFRNYVKILQFYSTWDGQPGSDSMCRIECVTNPGKLTSLFFYRGFMGPTASLQLNHNDTDIEQWHMYTIVVSKENAITYCDNIFKESKPVTNWSINGTFYFGGTAGGVEFNISDFRIYAGCLTEEEITDLYQMSAYVTNTNMLAAYELSEFNEETELNDKGIFYSSEINEEEQELEIFENKIISNSFSEI